MPEPWPQALPAAPELLHTPRTCLERMSALDLPELARLHRDERMMATLGGVRSGAETMAFAERLVSHWALHGFGWWMIRERASGRLAGRGGLRRVQIDGRDEVEVGYALLPAFWGRGLATEVAAASVQVAFTALGLAELVCFTLPTNSASRRVMEKAGFQFEREFVYAGLGHVLYRLRADDWRHADGVARVEIS